MTGKKRKNIRDEDITGLKYFDKLQPLLKRLHDVSHRLIGGGGFTRKKNG